MFDILHILIYMGLSPSLLLRNATYRCLSKSILTIIKLSFPVLVFDLLQFAPPDQDL